MAGVATDLRTEIHVLATDLRDEMHQMETGLRADIAALRQDVTRELRQMLVATIAVNTTMIGLVLGLPHMF